MNEGKVILTKNEYDTMVEKGNRLRGELDRCQELLSSENGAVITIKREDGSFNTEVVSIIERGVLVGVVESIVSSCLNCTPAKMQLLEKENRELLSIVSRMNDILNTVGNLSDNLLEFQNDFNPCGIRK